MGGAEPLEKKPWYQRNLIELQSSKTRWSVNPLPACFVMPPNVLQDSPAEPQFAKVDDLPPPTLSRAGEVDAGGVELRGAEGRRLRCSSAQGDQQVPGGAKVSGELETHRVGGGALGCAAHIDLRDQNS